MALMQCSFFSDVLGVTTHANVILPQEALAGRPLPGAVPAPRPVG